MQPILRSFLRLLRTDHFYDLAPSPLRARALLVLQVALLLAMFFAIGTITDGMLSHQLVRGAMHRLHLHPPLPMTAAHELNPGAAIFHGSLEFIPFVIAAFLMSRIEARPWGSYGLPLDGAALRSFSAGAFGGIAAMAVLLLALKTAGAISFGPALAGGDALRYAALWMLASVVLALNEEFAFRGYLLFTAARAVTFWPAALALSTMFAAAHLHNRGETKLGIATVFFFALAFCFFLRVTGSLWLAVGFHAGWDFAQDFLFGVPDSGAIAHGRLFAPAMHGPQWLTGGSAGPEGSVLCPVLLALVEAAVAWRYRESRSESASLAAAAGCES